jgi:hypothetical protein
MKKIAIVCLSVIVASCGVGLKEDSGFSVVDGGNVSQGGSLARFSIVGDYLYIVDDYSLVPIDITSLDNPETLDKIDLGVGIETIFAYGDNLFIGSSSAVYIYNISDPANPIHQSTYFHATGCDPVVVSGDYAYVTLREGFSCGNIFNINVLEVIDVSNVRNPIQVNQVQMSNPRGLGLGCNNKLYVCEGASGFKQFDVTDPSNPVFERIYDDFHANDLIIRDDLVIVTGEEGVYQYRCDADSLQALSYLPYAL